MSYHIARIIPQKHIKGNTLLYFGDGSIGYIASEVNVKDFCVVRDDYDGYGKYQYVDNLENILVIERPHKTKWDKDLCIDTKIDFAIVLLENMGWGGTQPKGIFFNGTFYCKGEANCLDNEDDFNDNLLSDCELSVVEELFFSQLIRFNYREITPELLIELYNTAEVRLSGLNIEDIINSFTIEGWLARDCKSGKDNDWTVDCAHMESHIKYSDLYIEHILPPQNYFGHTDACGNGIPGFYYRDDLEQFLAEKAAAMRRKAVSSYSRKEHTIYIVYKLLSDILYSNSKYQEYKKRVHNNYIEYWHNGNDNKVRGNTASKEWLNANVFVNNKITDSNIREMIFEHNKSLKKWPYSFTT
ncbi:MAG: hypothetical protein K6E93_05215 [Bacteroidales bacterium]|nr:hypothetical protein [Bacteroidales bacterium]